MCIPFRVAFKLAILSKPEPALLTLIVSLVAVTVTVLKSRAISWVQNGNPWMVTSGLPDRPKDDWTWLAIWFSVYALATKSLTTRSTMITTTVINAISGPLLRRLRSCGGGPGGSCAFHHSGRGRVGSALMT